MTRLCIDCGKVPVEGRTFCPRCRKRIAKGIPVDVDDVPTYRVCRAAAYAGPGIAFDQGWRRQR